MHLRLVRLTGSDEHSVAVLYHAAWVPLVPALARYRAAGGTVTAALAAASGDLLEFLGGGAPLRGEAEAILAAVNSAPSEWATSFHPDPLLPFTLRSFRDCMLYEVHAIAAARGLARHFVRRAWPLAAAYEAILQRPFPLFRPKPLWYERPIYYHGNHLSFLPDGATIPWPSYTQMLDYEIELSVIIARPLHDATPTEAIEAIGGFTILNDFSARDVQYPEMRSGFGPVKAKNFASSLGPVVVTPDEILPILDRLSFTVHVNGKRWGAGTTAGMAHSLGTVVAYASLGERLVPGELLGLGTLPGGSGMETNQWLKPGDTIELTIKGIGTLTNIIGLPATENR
jgi:2-keto-4-pentenoate hydratase/2-oxohepta-3-ene-1,7-dioic acid hydratase in catechol pathway